MRRKGWGHPISSSSSQGPEAAHRCCGGKACPPNGALSPVTLLPIRTHALIPPHPIPACLTCSPQPHHTRSTPRSLLAGLSTSCTKQSLGTCLWGTPPAPHPGRVWAPGSGPCNLPFPKMLQCSPGKTRGGQNVEHIPECQQAAYPPITSPRPGWGQADSLTLSVRCHPATSSQIWSHPASAPRGRPPCWLRAQGKPSAGEDSHELPGETPSPSRVISDGGRAVRAQHCRLPAWRLGWAFSM